MIIGHVIATVHVTLNDLDDPYVPLGGYALILYGAGRDSTVARADDAGVASSPAPAGNYRFASSRSYTWKG